MCVCVHARTGARVFGCVCVRVRACVCVCVCVRERERDRQTDRQTDRQIDEERVCTVLLYAVFWFVYVFP